MTHLTSAPATPGKTPRTGARLGMVLVSHTAVDTYSAFLMPLLGVLQVRCDLTPEEAAWLLGIGPLGSGLSQPCAAWFADKFDTRLFGPFGLILAAVTLSSIGFAENFTQLAVLYLVGVIGVGIYHPVGAACTGQLAHDLGSTRRSLGVSVFFVAGMLGGVLGVQIATRIAIQPSGFDILRMLMIPGILIAGALHLAIRRVPHRHADHREIVFSTEEVRRRWGNVSLLWIGNVMRFLVNNALIYLVLRWAERSIALANPQWTQKEVAHGAAPLNGDLQAMMITGMAIGGLTAGALIRAGRERTAMIIVPMLGAPFIALFPNAGTVGAYALAIVAGIAFAAMVPVTLAVSQRLLPHRTSLASGLMLGGSWFIGMFGPRLAEWGLDHHGLGTTFTATAVLLGLSGLLNLALSGHLLQRTAVETSGTHSDA